MAVKSPSIIFQFEPVEGGEIRTVAIPPYQRTQLQEQCSPDLCEYVKFALSRSEPSLELALWEKGLRERTGSKLTGVSNLSFVHVVEGGRKRRKGQAAEQIRLTPTLKELYSQIGSPFCDSCQVQGEQDAVQFEEIAGSALAVAVAPQRLLGDDLSISLEVALESLGLDFVILDSHRFSRSTLSEQGLLGQSVLDLEKQFKSVELVLDTGTDGLQRLSGTGFERLAVHKFAKGSKESTEPLSVRLGWYCPKCDQSLHLKDSSRVINGLSMEEVFEFSFKELQKWISDASLDSALTKRLYDVSMAVIEQGLGELQLGQCAAELSAGEQLGLEIVALRLFGLTDSAVLMWKLDSHLTDREYEALLNAADKLGQQRNTCLVYDGDPQECMPPDLKLVSTVCGAEGQIADLFGGVRAARLRGFTSDSFLLAKSQELCMACMGEGYTGVDIEALKVCALCEGSRFDPFLSEVTYKEKSFAQLQLLSISEAKEFFWEADGLHALLADLELRGCGDICLGDTLAECSENERALLKKR